jgi:hypothetical protein
MVILYNFFAFFSNDSSKIIVLSKKILVFLIGGFGRNLFGQT